MVDVVEADEGQAAKRGKATDGEGQRTQPPQPVVPAGKQRQPTPDHPPYCWMISEAIDALGEYGGSEEDSISAFIRARHPGVPAAHDRLLRHYLGKHVAEGVFVRSAAGRYERSPEENAAEELPVKQAAAGSSGPSCVVSPPVVEAKRGRGRPRKDGSSSTPPAGKKDGSSGARLKTPKRATLAAVKDSVPTSPLAVADKDGSQAPSLTPKRRGRPRKKGMATATDSSDKALVAGKKDGSEVPYTSHKEHEPPRELALVVFGGSSAATSIMDKACTEASPIKPVDVDQPLGLALVTTADAPAPCMDKEKEGGDAPSFNLALVAKNDSICTTATAPERSSRACKLTLKVADEKDGVKEVPSAAYKHVRQPRKTGSSPTAGKAGEKALLSATSKGRRRQRKPAVAAIVDRSAFTPAAGKKVGCKVSSASPKLTPVIAGGCSTPALVAHQGSTKASAPLKRLSGPHKLYPITAEEISDDATSVLLALPSQTPAAPASNA